LRTADRLRFAVTSSTGLFELVPTHHIGQANPGLLPRTNPVNAVVRRVRHPPRTVRAEGDAEGDAEGLTAKGNGRGA